MGLTLSSSATLRLQSRYPLLPQAGYVDHVVRARVFAHECKYVYGSTDVGATVCVRNNIFIVCKSQSLVKVFRLRYIPALLSHNGTLRYIVLMVAVLSPAHTHRLVGLSTFLMSLSNATRTLHWRPVSSIGEKCLYRLSRIACASITYLTATQLTQ